MRLKPNGYALQTFLGNNTAAIEKKASTFHGKGQQECFLAAGVCISVYTDIVKSKDFLGKQYISKNTGMRCYCSCQV